MKGKLQYWVGFNRVSGIGPARLGTLIQRFGDVEEAWKAPVTALSKCGLDQRTLDNLIKARQSFDLDALLLAVEKAGAHIIPIESDEYPLNLLPIPDPPIVLYVKGTLTEADRLAVAVVGTRRATTYGKTMTQRLVEPLVQRGVTIVSGLAHGIDTVAHQTALDAGGRTIAVLPCGIDRVFPPENAALAEAITQNGALVTEFSVGTPALRSNFAPRNRIISGLALGVIIAEAGEKSGALITADQALEQGRDVFAIPGNVLSATSAGTNELIRSGAKIVTSEQDILEELRDLRLLSPQITNVAVTKAAPTATSSSPSGMNYKPANATEAVILRCLATQSAQHVNEIAHQSGLTIEQVSAALVVLELNGIVQEVGAMFYATNPDVTVML